MKLNRYARLKQHKKALKQHHAYKCSNYSINADRSYWERNYEKYKDKKWMRYNDPRNNGYWYWNRYELSGKRRIAKENTNAVLRARYRNLTKQVLISDLEGIEDIDAPQNSDYEKYFDYWWFIY